MSRGHGALQGRIVLQIEVAEATYDLPGYSLPTRVGLTVPEIARALYRVPAEHQTRGLRRAVAALVGDGTLVRITIGPDARRLRTARYRLAPRLRRPSPLRACYRCREVYLMLAGQTLCPRCDDD